MAVNTGNNRGNSKDKGDVVTFEITEHIGVITSYSTGWSKELNLVAWNEGQPKYDLRDWDNTHEHMSRGITLHKEEEKKLLDLLAGQNLAGRDVAEQNLAGEDVEEQDLAGEDSEEEDSEEI